MASYLSNKRVMANLTHLYWFDASTGLYSPNLMNALLPYALLPPVPAVGDYLYAGCDSTLLNSGPFFEIVFNLVAGTGITMDDLEVFTAAGWAVPPQLNDETTDFLTSGSKGIFWSNPTASNLNTTAINGVTGWWARTRVGAIGVPVPPRQTLFHPYAVVWPHQEVYGPAIKGDMSALANLNVSVKCWQTGTFDLALRELSRGADFIPAINCADEQNPAFVTVALIGAGTSFANTNYSGTNRCVDWTRVGATPSTTLFSITVASGHFSGRYKMQILVRCTVNGSTVQITAKPTLFYPATFLSKIFRLSSGAVYGEVIEVGDLYVPFGVSSLYIQVDASLAGAGTIQFYSIRLIPADEEEVYSQDIEGSVLADINHNISIDSIANAKKDVITTLFSDTTLLKSEEWLTAISGRFELPSNHIAQDIMLYGFPRLTAVDAGEAPETWEVLSLKHVARYLSMRGAQ